MSLLLLTLIYYSYVNVVFYNGMDGRDIKLPDLLFINEVYYSYSLSFFNSFEVLDILFTIVSKDFLLYKFLSSSTIVFSLNDL